MPNGTQDGESSSGQPQGGVEGENETQEDASGSGVSGEDDFKDAVAAPSPTNTDSARDGESVADGTNVEKEQDDKSAEAEKEDKATPNADGVEKPQKSAAKDEEPEPALNTADAEKEGAARDERPQLEDRADVVVDKTDTAAAEHKGQLSRASGPERNSVSEFSHQQVTMHADENDQDDDDGWQTMPAFAPYDMYDDDNRLIAKEYNEAEADDQTYSYGGIGGAGKGYTRVFVDDDAESVTSMDDNTQYLFKNAGGTSMMDDEDTRDAVSQMQATKDLLTEGQKIAYVGLVRIELSQIVKDMEGIPHTRAAKKAVQLAVEAAKMWSQKIMIRLYTHMDISSAEQIMIEQLSEHGVISSDLTPQLMANARVKNPMADRKSSVSSSRPSSVASPKPPQSGFSSPSRVSDEAAAEPPPAYDKHEGEELPAVRTPSQLPSSDKLDIDIRWTILCDLFLVLIADSIYDARSRCLLERVGKALEIDWIDICRFEKRVTEALEMQQQAERENWNEDEHKESRRKLALKKRYIVMGLATVGGGLVIGLSAGLLAPVIGAGLAAGFTTIGVTGTSTFLGGAAASAIITSGAAASGGVIGARAANRRTGAVKTFEYRPLHNNKRVNLVVTVAGWMTGKVDDVRLPFSTIDPVMGDIYSVLWEPEMLTSMGDTINILATEALTQGLQQVLGSTILVSLMAALQLPVVLTKLSYLIDNPWSVSLDRAWAAGLILADSLIERNLGTRPITLVGYSLGSRVIFSCLLELARKGAVGLVQNVYMFGSPIVVKTDEYLKVRTVVSGRFVNGYHRNDWILGYLFRLTNGGIRRVAGLAPVEGIPGLENMDASEFVAGHMDYRRSMPRLMRESGWLVESDEFAEIENPDPENHTDRQRELINEIEEARKQLEKEGNANSGRKSGAFGGFFSRRKKAQKAEWEVYEDSKGAGASEAGAAAAPSGKTEDKDGNNHGVLFDVDAMRAELARSQTDETLQVRELQSTLPPMRIPSPRVSLSQTKSDYAGYHSKHPSSDYGPSGAHHQHQYQPDHDDEIQMTFDTGFDEPPRSQRSQTIPAADHSSYTAARPEIKTAHTVPNIGTAASNPWADPDDDDFGKEEEISMTFA
ncbi:DUF726-domain-containing protein [Cryphonectria parasitica EP155]|uniref:DUF726-domain-containing protein n=1 Tax=Cryphonectria parasitica (strain ATCC 38755 / EP155) TaxID=660469 RepID=A0A9P4XWC4_CRYP1|nr:DUF726-domain-containing protein [Cryphonectria parasitica EP155]KAF3762489.1 DUF726-domain-containing protein [Cryphonectria parasitica EP155]